MERRGRGAHDQKQQQGRGQRNDRVQQRSLQDADDAVKRQSRLRAHPLVGRREHWPVGSDAVL